MVKDTIREIRKSLGRFISLFAICFIGVAFFAGITASSKDMKHSSDSYYDEYNLCDIDLCLIKALARTILNLSGIPKELMVYLPLIEWMQSHHLMEYSQL